MVPILESLMFDNSDYEMQKLLLKFRIFHTAESERTCREHLFLIERFDIATFPIVKNSVIEHGVCGGIS